MNDRSPWEASWELDEFGNSAWYKGFFDANHRYCFRQLKVNPKRTWYKPWIPYFTRTGKIWIGGTLMAGNFEMLP